MLVGLYVGKQSVRRILAQLPGYYSVIHCNALRERE